MNDEVFVKITNRDIYNEIKAIKKQNNEEHLVIMQKQDATNGKVRLSRWIATTGISLSLIALGFLFNHLSK